MRYLRSGEVVAIVVGGPNAVGVGRMVVERMRTHYGIDRMRSCYGIDVSIQLLRLGGVIP